MNAPNSMWTPALIREKPDLFRLIHDFNHRPGYWVHPERTSTLPHAEVASALLQRGYGLPRLHEWVGARFALALKESACWDFSEPRQRLALLSHDVLAKLATFCGAAWRWNRISKIIRGAEITELKKHIGERAHVFALRRGRQVVDERAAAESSLEGRTLVQEIHELGWTTVFSALGGEAAAILDRFVLKLPGDVPQFNFFGVNARTRDAAWQRVRKVLPEILTKEEMKCFA